MSTLPIWMMVVGASIVFILASYAGWLLAKLRHQTTLQLRQRAKAIAARNKKIIESVDIIAKATLQQQCDLSEAAIRLYMLMAQLQGELQLDFAHRFPALYELYTVVEHMPREQARKDLPKQERMRHDVVRLKAEAKLEQAIHQELEQILIFIGAKSASV